MSKHANASALVADLGQVFLPPRRIAVNQAAENVVTIATPGGYSGKWSGEQTPYMVEPMNLINSRLYESVIFAGPARTGKTQALIDCGIAYVATCDPSDMLVIHMTEGAARRYSRLRVKRMINNSPELKARLSTHAHDDNVLAKYFRNGTALVFGWPSPTQLSAQDYKYVFMSDYDRMPDDCGEGDVYSLGRKRTTTFMSGGMTLVESSPGRDFTKAAWKPRTIHEAPPVGGILGLYNTGDRRLWFWNCVECKDPMPIIPGLGLFNLPDQTTLNREVRENGVVSTASKHCRIVCPNCGCEIEHKWKNGMNLGGFWNKERPDQDNSVASFWLGGVAAKFQSWQSLLEKEFSAMQHFIATGEQEKLKATRNTDQGIPYIPAGALNKMNAVELLERAEDIGKRVVPAGVRCLFGSVDVQIHKFVCQVQGLGVDRESWIIDRFDICISDRETHGELAVLDPAAYKSDWRLLIDSIITKRYPLDDDSGRTMGVVMTTCDSGGRAGVAENSYSFWKEIKGLGLDGRFSLIKGDRPKPESNKPMASLSYPDEASKAARKADVAGVLPLWVLNTTALKDAVAANLKRKDVGPDYMHFPDWLGEWFFQEIVSETRTSKGWENKARESNEAFDLICYAKAAFLIKMDSYWKSKVDWAHPPAWLDTWDHNSEVSSLSVDAPVRSPTKGRRVRMRVKR